MAMTNFVSILCLVLPCSVILVGSSTLAAARESSLDGTYILDQTDSDNINQVIETAVAKLNFLTRDIARGRLEKLNPAYGKVAITSSPNESASPWITSRRYGHRRRVHLWPGLVLTEER
jgi:hypothetical protein